MGNMIINIVEGKTSRYAILGTFIEMPFIVHIIPLIRRHSILLITNTV